MNDIIVRSRKEAECILRKRPTDVGALVSIYEPYSRANDGKPCYGFGPFSGPKIGVAFHDVEREMFHLVPPSREDVERLLNWFRGIRKQTVHRFNDRRPLLIHCAAGISRSSATAFAFRCLRGEKPEDALRRIVEDRPMAWPNELIVRHADEALERSGAMLSALKKMDEISPVTLPTNLLKKAAGRDDS